MALRILVIDDHFLLVEGYKSAFKKIMPDTEIEIVEAYNCESAYNLITGSNNRDFDLVFLDISLPPFHEKRINDGGDIGALIRREWPKCKILALTSHPESILLYDFYKRLRPEGLMVKSDFTVKDLEYSLKVIHGGGQYVSSTVRSAIAAIGSKERFLDNINRQIISFLAKGIKTKSMGKYLPLSVSAIDKRKAHIKDYFLIAKGTDEDIIREARKAGLI